MERPPDAPLNALVKDAAHHLRNSIVTTTDSVELADVDGTSDRAKTQTSPVAVTCPDGASATIRGCRGVFVLLSGRPAAVYLRDLVDCTVIAGPVAGAVIAHNVSGCRLVLACRQCRLTGVRDTDASLRTSSAPTLEECSGIRIRGLRASDLVATNPDVDEPALTAAGLGQSVQAWRKVQDFDWLVEGPSPNWTIIEDATA